jgi:hypothetical protein
MKKEFLYVQPKSIQAKNKFVEMMDRLHSCVVQKRENGKVFLASITGRYFFCIPESGDDHWEIIK